MRSPPLSTLLAGLVLLAVSAGCGGREAATPVNGDAASARLVQRDPGNAGRTITIGSKNFTESVVVARIYGQALRAAGYDVAYDLRLGFEQDATAAVRAGRVDGYPEYTGTSLSAILGVPIARVPKDPDDAWELSRRLYGEQLGFVAFARTPFEDANAVGLLPGVARRIGNPRRISDLAPFAEDLRLAGSPECFRRTDCARGLEEVYGLRFAREVPIDLADRHEVVEEGRADVTIPFTTDGRIAENRMRVLEDDKDLFPPYNVHFVIRADAERRLGPDAQRVVEAVDDGLTNGVMTELNARVDLDGETPEDVARTYLRESGYVR